MKRLLPFVLLGLSANAHAWKHTERVWLPQDMPLPYTVAAEQDCEETVPPEYCETVIAQGFAAWEAAECAEFSTTYTGNNPNAGFVLDGLNTVSFNDPADQLEPGVIAAALTIGNEPAFVLNAIQYRHSVDTDITFNNNVNFATHEDVVGANCTDEQDMLAVAVHEIGHSLGMGHSCEEEDACEDILLREATMYWSSGACEPNQAEINRDDIEGFTALYGPSATFTCSNELTENLAIGVIPFEVKCVVESEYINEITSTSWSFGDGEFAEGKTASHTYTEAGNYSVRMTVEGERESCGDEGWENSFRKIGYIRACDVPEAEFSIKHVDGLKYQLVNESNISVYGCIQDLQWDVFAGESKGGQSALPSLKAWEPVIEFPEEGTYTVVLNLGGPAGTGAAKLIVEAKDLRGAGRSCSFVEPAGGAAGLLVLAGMLGMRRRS